jgi:predicted ABC-type ATPase
MGEPQQPICWIIAGPDGAGKTTFALRFLPEVGCRHFVNADLIAAGLSPLAPESELMAASRLYLREVEQHIHARRDFAFETTLAGRGYLHWVKRLKATGWRVELIYLALPSLEMSKMRVAERVSHGGHDIPASAIERRFARSLRNLLDAFAQVADRTRCFMNSGETPALIFTQAGGTREILDSAVYDHLQQEAKG